MTGIPDLMEVSMVIHIDMEEVGVSSVDILIMIKHTKILREYCV